MKTNNYHCNPFRNKLIFGSLIIVVGLVLFGLNFGFIPQAWKPILFSWQMLVILLGIIELCCAKFFKAIVLLLVGGFFLIPDFYRAYPDHFRWASADFVQIYWPLLLVAGGIILIVYWLLPEKYKRKHLWRRRGYYYSRFYDESKAETDGEGNGDNEQCDDDVWKSKKHKKHDGTFNKSAIFAGCDEIFLEEVFPGGEINIVFGGVNLDLRRTTLPEGKTYLEMNVVFGGIQMYVPNAWQIEIHTDNIAAGFVDSRCVDHDNVDKTRKLIITGSCVFGGGEINS
jgi:predicted membrane protein